MENSILYIQRLRQLLQMEYEDQKNEYRMQSERMGIHRKIRRGMCWFPLEIGRSSYNSLNQFVVDVYNRAEDTEEDIEPLFEYGRPVQFFYEEEGKLQYFPFTSVVSYVDGNRMVAALPGPQSVLDLQGKDNVGVQLAFDETSFKTMFHALDDAMTAKNNRLAYLREVFAGQSRPLQRTFSPMRLPWLNATQEEAVNKVLWAKDVEIVHGPPGTGKTTTLVEAIHETLRRETQVMVCAQSNMAVDWISEKLVDRGISVLRIGNPSRVNDKMLSFTYERKFEAHPLYPELWSIRKTIRQMKENRKSGENIHQKVARLRDRASEIEMSINAQLFDEARVVACTLVGASSKLLVRHKFSTLFIDEAAQALEPACWIAIRRASRVILAGDHQQLPPTIKCYDAMRQGLAKTLMERIAENQPGAVTLLRVQYRMNEAIMRFSSQWFYQGEVQSDPSVRHRSVLDYDNPIEWIDGNEKSARKATAVTTESADKTESARKTECEDMKPCAEKTESTATTECSAGGTGEPTAITDDDKLFKEEYVGENHGRINKAEADLVLSTLVAYIEKIGKQRFLDERLDVGIISPYKVQTQYLRQRIRRMEELRPFRQSITVNTVDGFQGQERDIVFISLVRSNDNGEIGFLSDLRRMNVAMTRARMKLIIFGDKETLRHHSFYRKLISYIEQTSEHFSE